MKSNQSAAPNRGDAAEPPVKPVAEYVAVLPPDLRNTVLDSLTLPETQSAGASAEKRGRRGGVFRTIEDERIHKAHREVTAKTGGCSRGGNSASLPTD